MNQNGKPRRFSANRFELGVFASNVQNARSRCEISRTRGW